MVRTLSILGLAIMVLALVGLISTNALFSASPAVIAVQACAVVLLIWARTTFGIRSFHASAGPTKGGLVTTGPYAFIRHPIYTAVSLFGWAGILAHWSLLSISLGLLLLAGAMVRMLCEERLIPERYPEYRQYMARTKRMVPYLFRRCLDSKVSNGCRNSLRFGDDVVEEEVRSRRSEKDQRRVM